MLLPKLINLKILRSNSPLEVLTVTTRTRLSSPGCTYEIRPNGQVAGGRLDSFMMTKPPYWRFSSGFLHLALCWRECNSPASAWHHSCTSHLTWPRNIRNISTRLKFEAPFDGRARVICLGTSSAVHPVALLNAPLP
ncbi:hypothetical protein CDAR_427881 [Caerostris darwini]|uniref:Uncharacterized protein n=1 Tax=Caerostris darwini TaxID=1538125 RepID=A0AAV4Q918_9ARAC|nr:hypothetical protein CDAR_427881 [Caerostris darwini]